MDLLEAGLDASLLLQSDVELVEQYLASVLQSAELQIVPIVVIFLCGFFSRLFPISDLIAANTIWCPGFIEFLALTSCATRHLDDTVVAAALFNHLPVTE